LLRERWKGIEPEDRPPLGDALVDLVQETRIANLVAHGLLGPRAGAFIIDRGRLRWFLRSLPGVPGLPFQKIDLLQFQFAGLVEVADTRFPPLLANLFQVIRDRRLADPEMLGDLGLRPVLQVVSARPDGGD
jgi:hypothetical protein